MEGELQMKTTFVALILVITSFHHLLTYESDRQKYSKFKNYIEEERFQI